MTEHTATHGTMTAKADRLSHGVVLSATWTDGTLMPLVPRFTTGDAAFVGSDYRPDTPLADLPDAHSTGLVLLDHEAKAIRDALLDAYPLGEPFTEAESVGDLETSERRRRNQRTQLVRQAEHLREMERELEKTRRERDEALDAAERAEGKVAALRRDLDAEQRDREALEDRARTCLEAAERAQEQAGTYRDRADEFQRALREERDRYDDLRNRPRVGKARMEEAVAMQEAMSRQLATVRAERDEARREMCAYRERVGAGPSESAHADLSASQRAFTHRYLGGATPTAPLSGALLIHPENATPEALAAVIRDLSELLARKAGGQ